MILRGEPNLRIKFHTMATEKHSHMMIGGKQIGGPRPGGRNQDGHGMTKSEDFFTLQISHPRSGNNCVCDGVCTHTPCHTHIFFALFDVQTRTRMAQGVCSAHVISLHLTLSILMFRPPSLLFPHGHFDTSFPSAPSLPNCSRSDSAGQAHFRTSGEGIGYLADPTHSTASCGLALGAGCEAASLSHARGICPSASCSSRSVDQDAKPSVNAPLKTRFRCPPKYGADHLGADGRHLPQREHRLHKLAPLVWVRQVSAPFEQAAPPLLVHLLVDVLTPRSTFNWCHHHHRVSPMSQRVERVAARSVRSVASCSNSSPLNRLAVRTSG